MARISFEDVKTNDENNVGFFSLKNDGEEATVRFMCDSLSDLEILTVHNIEVDGKFRQINCIREPNDPIESCPLCANDTELHQVVFIKVMNYKTDNSGKITAYPEIWQRNASSYVPKMKSYLDNYGPLSNIVCKVVRHGAARSPKTTYDIIPNLNPQVYTMEAYPLNTEAFEDYSVVGRVILDKNREDIMTFCNTGIFPQHENQGIASQTSYTTAEPVSTINNGVVYDEKPAEAFHNPNVSSEPIPNAGYENDTVTQIDRPVRHY